MHASQRETARGCFRLLEPPLGPDAISKDARADLAELLAIFDASRHIPPPDYATLTLLKAFRL